MVLFQPTEDVDLVMELTCVEFIEHLRYRANCQEGVAIMSCGWSHGRGGKAMAHGAKQASKGKLGFLTYAVCLSSYDVSTR